MAGIGGTIGAVAAFFLYSRLEEMQFGTKKDTEDKEMMKGLLTNHRTT